MTNEPMPELADQVAGSYVGAVISDARGSSREDVAIIVTKIGPAEVRVESDYPRIPAREFGLIRVTETIQNAEGSEVFLFEIDTNPNRLSLTIDDASWAGERRD